MSDIYAGLLALTTIVGVFAVSEIISIKSKSIFSIMFVSTIVFVIGFTSGLFSKSVFEDAHLYNIGNSLVAVLIVHLGTTLNFNTLKEQWKIILIALFAELGIVLFVFAFGYAFFDISTIASSVSPIGGGVVATLIIHKAAYLQNLNDIIVYTTLLLSASSFLGYPIASFFLKKEAKQILKTQNKKIEIEIENEKNDRLIKIKALIRFFEKFNSPIIIFAKLTLIAFLSIFISNLTNNTINGFIICLILGFIFKELGFLEFDSLNKSNSYGFTMIAVLSVIFHRFSSISVDMILNSLLPIIFFLFVGMLGMLSFSFFLGRKLKISKYLSMSVGISCMFGFPGTYIIPNEVAKTIGKTKAEQDIILKGIYPQMLIAGFVNVTIASVVIASLLVKFL